MEEEKISQQEMEDRPDSDNKDGTDSKAGLINYRRSRQYGTRSPERKEYSKKGHQVIVQVVMNSKISTHHRKSAIEIDLLYENIYELK